MVAQAAGVDGRRHEAVAERVHLDQRRQADRVAEVVGVAAAGQGRAGFGLDGEDARRAALAQLLADERKGQPGEVRAAADAADHHVGVLPCEVHLLERFLADDRLVQQHVVEH